MKRILCTIALTVFLCAPTLAHAQTTVKKHKVHHVKTTAVVTTPGGDPHTVTGKVVKKTKQAGHKVSYTTWKLTHPNQARAEYDAEQAADAQREAADKAHENQYHATH